MQDPPTPIEILKAVTAYLRTTLPKLTGHDAFQMRVSIAALELVVRELQLSPASDAAEHERLKALLGRDGPLAELNEDLSQRIERGQMDVDAPGLRAHLWASIMEKLAVDQPGYASYRRALEARTKDD